MNGGLHATTGPNIIFWDPQQTASGNYTVKATFTVTKPPSHPVAYGLFIGGANLDQDSQKYSYFVIREDGQFLIKKRNGAATSNVAGDWAANPAVTVARRACRRTSCQFKSQADASASWRMGRKSPVIRRRRSTPMASSAFASVMGWIFRSTASR